VTSGRAWPVAAEVRAIAPAAEVPLARATRVGIQTWEAPPEQVLPLLTPLGEKAWAVDWAPDIRWQAPGNGEGTLFVTYSPGGNETVWVLQTFDALNLRVAYTHLRPGVLLVELSITLLPLPGGRTRGEVRYTYTALSERGNARVMEMSEAHYARFMQDWERELNHFLRTGRKPDPPQR
jgi:hypothetical protein